MTHASSVAEMLRQAEEDEELPDHLRERCGDRADELEEVEE